MTNVVFIFLGVLILLLCIITFLASVYLVRVCKYYADEVIKNRTQLSNAINNYLSTLPKTENK